MPSLKQSRDGTIRMDFAKGHSSVIIPTTNNKYTLCLSTQVGCTMDCSFCHSNAFQENLRPEEIILQFEMGYAQFPITSIVFMGMGEPMANFDAVTEAIEHMHKAHSLAYKKITLSTIGKDLAKLIDAPYHVAVSLHGAREETRKRLVPFGASVSEIIAFAKSREDKNKNVMIEYALIKGVNDSDDECKTLLSHDWPQETNFNLIEYNPKDEFVKSTRLSEWKQAIRDKGYKCFIRESRGRDIGAACGMLQFDE